jgi:hypothetical protein
LKSSHSPAETFIKSIYPGFRILDLGFRIQDLGPTTATKEEGEKLSKYGFEIQDRGVKKTPDPQHWITVNGCVFKNSVPGASLILFSKY